MAAPNDSLATFRQAYFGPIDDYLAWHDGFRHVTNLAWLNVLPPARRQQAAETLLAGLRAQRISNDKIFRLISKHGLFGRHGAAQRLLLAELPAATVATFSLHKS